MSTVPGRRRFIGDTIGVHFDRIVERFAERDALIVRHQQVRWTYRELKEQADAFAGGLLALGLKRGDRVGVWSPNNAEWVIARFATAKAGLILVNINPAYRLAELEYALNKAGCVALITATQFKTSDYVGMLRELAPELAGAPPGNLHASRLPALRLVITHRRRPRPRRSAVRRCFPSRRGCRAAPPCRTRRRAAIRRPDQHPVYQRHDRLSQECHAQPPQYSEQRFVHCPGDEADRARPGMHSGAALSLLWHGNRQSRLPNARVGNGLPGRRLRPSRHPRSDRRGTLYGGLRRADDVHRRVGPSRLYKIRSDIAAHRNDGRQPLSDRGHEACLQLDAPLRDRHRLWHDRDEPGELCLGDR